MATKRTKPPPDKVAEIAKRVRSVDEHGPYAKVLVYGENGKGKTRFAASAPNVIIIDILEEGTRSAKGSGADVLEVETWAEVGDAYWWLQSGNHSYESVALDTLTAMQSVAMSFVLGEAEARDPTREKAMPDKRSYGRAGQLMRGMLTSFRNLPMNVVFTAQERKIRDEDTEEIEEITVDLPNSSRGTAMGCVGIIGRLTSKEVMARNKETGKRTKKFVDHLTVAAHDVIRTKDRTNNLPGVLKKPTMADILDAWNN